MRWIMQVKAISTLQYLFSQGNLDSWRRSVCNRDFVYVKERQLQEPSMLPSLLESEDIEEQRVIEQLLEIGSTMNTATGEDQLTPIYGVRTRTQWKNLHTWCLSTSGFAENSWFIRKGFICAREM